MCPVVAQYQRQVAEAPLPGVRVPTSAPEGAFSPVDTGPATSVIVNAQRKAAFEADQMAVDTADRSLSDARVNILQNPDTGVLNLQGINALQALPKAQEAWQKATDEIGSTLTNDNQREAFSRLERGHYGKLTEQVAAHTSAQLRQSDIQNTTSFLNEGLQTVNDDPTQSDAVVTAARQKLIEFGGRQGWTPDMMRDKAAAHVSDIRAAAISTLVHQGTPESIQQARTYLDAHKSELVGQQRDDAEELVDKGKTQSDGLKAADDILGNGPDSGVLPSEGQQQGVVPPKPKVVPKSRAQALAEAEAIPDFATRKVAVEALMSHFNTTDRAQHLDRQDALVKVTQQLESSGGRLDITSPAYKLIQGHPEGREALAQQKQLLHPPPDPGNPEAFTEAMNLALHPNGRDLFLRQTPKEWHAAGMNTREVAQLLTMQGHDETRSTADRVTAETLRFQRQNALLKVGDPSSSNYIADKAKRDTEVSRIKTHYDALQSAHGIVSSTRAPANATSIAPSGPSGDVNLDGPSTGPAAVTSNALDGMLTAAPPLKAPTQSMLEDVKRKGPGYGEYLRGLHYDVPSYESLTAPAKPDPIPLPTTPAKKTSVTIKRDAAGRATTMIKEEH